MNESRISPLRRALRRTVAVGVVFAIACGIAAASSADAARSPDVFGRSTKSSPSRSKTVSVFNFRLSSNSAETNAVTVALRQFAQGVTQESNGQVNFTVYPNLQLGPEDVVLASVESGSINAAALSDAIISTQISEFGLLGLPFVFNSLIYEEAMLNGFLGQKLSTMLVPKNAVVLAWLTSGARVLISRKPVRTVADFKGLKIRVPQNKVSVGLFEALGANPTPIAYPEVYPALQSGVVDAVEVGAQPIYAAKFWEVAKNLTLTHHQQTTAVVIMNKRDWGSLSPALQKIVKRNAQKASAAQWRADKAGDAEAVELMAKAGVSVYHIDGASLRAATKPFLNSYAPSVGASAVGLLKQIERFQLPKLTGIVGPGSMITLKRAGAPVRTLKAGEYALTIGDKSRVQNFHLRGPGLNIKTGVAQRATKTYYVTLQRGTYTFVSDRSASSLKGSFRVT